MTAALKTKQHGYDEDFAAWSAEQAELIRQGRWSEVDLENVAEEIESLGRSDKRAIRSHLRVLMLHLLKWQHQPRRRSRSWRLSILNARREIDELLQESPGLRPQLPAWTAAEYSHAREAAAVEMGTALGRLPETCPYTPEQLFTPAFLPGGA